MQVKGQNVERYGAEETEDAPLLDGIAGIRVRRLQSLMTAHWQKWFANREHRLTQAQAGALLLIAQHPGISQIALARRLRIEPPSLLHSLGSLLKQGLVERQRSNRDARNFELRLTAVGLGAVEDVRAGTFAHEAEILRGLTPPEQAQFLMLLDRAIAGAEAAVEESQPDSAVKESL